MRVLFVNTKYLCYSSNTIFFADMEEALNELGVCVDYCEALDEESAQSQLSQLIGKTYDAIIDFNSVLPLAQTSDGTPLLDLVHAPFYNYIVDHPMLHHNSLQIPLKNYHIICIDRNHEQYVKKCYPHIKTVTFLPLAAMTAMKQPPFEKKKAEILFPGTYMPSKVHYDRIQSFDDAQKKDVLTVIDRMLANHTRPLEEIVMELFHEKGMELSDLEFREQMLSFRRADYFVRTYYRECLIEGLLKEGIHLEVLGCDWERFKTKYQSQIKIRDGVGYTSVVQMIANAKIVLNVQPLFKDGVHDRVLLAMANYALAVTDTSQYIEELFTDEQDLLLYEPDNISLLACKLRMYLENPDKLQKITESAHQKVMENHTWDVRMKRFVKLLES